MKPPSTSAAPTVARSTSGTATTRCWARPRSVRRSTRPRLPPGRGSLAVDESVRQQAVALDFGERSSAPWEPTEVVGVRDDYPVQSARGSRDADGLPVDHLPRSRSECYPD